MFSANFRLPGFLFGCLQIQRKAGIVASERGNRLQSSVMIFNMKFFVLTVFAGIFISLSEAILPCPADNDEDWTYRENNGPSEWGERYPMCYSQNQSPIEIETELVETDENLAQMELQNYNQSVTEATIVNNGHTIQVTPTDNRPRTIEVNGTIYTLRQLHFHWGFKHSEGSEHILDGRQYAMEMHLVHTTDEGRIAVVGIFLQERLFSNPALQPIVEQLNNVRFKNTTSQLTSELNLNNLLPANPTSFYRYDGSLTTPECDEGVTWSVVPDPIPVGVAQMLMFRTMSSATRDRATLGCTMARNYRPVQPLNTREVVMSL